MIKLCSAISTYFPDLIEVEENILSFIDQVDHLIIWENTPEKESKIDVLAAKLNNPKIEIRTTGRNEYLAEPFNTCARWAKENGFTHLLTMDQDSRFKKEHFEKYVQQINKQNDDKIVMFAPSSNSRNQVSSEISEVDHTFLSGAIFPLHSFLHFGGFNESLVIDAIDIEFCLKTKGYGMKTVIFADIFLQHQIGYRKKNSFGLTIVAYSAQRSYYFIRNTLWIWKQYPTAFDKTTRKNFIKYRIIFRILKIGFEKNAFKKLSAIIMGIIHYKKNRLGKYDKF